MTELKHILYVEDDPDIQSITQLALRNIGGFEVQSCDCGTKALDILKDYKPQLILLDVMMPELDGPSTLRAIRNLPETSQIPIIFITAKVQKSEIEEYIRMGAIGTIIKPFDPMTLASEVKSLWLKYSQELPH